MMKTFRPYQWDAIRDLSGHLWDGQRRVALIAPTGSGKSVIVACVLKRVSQTFKSAVIATPFVQVEESFASIKDDTWIAKPRHGVGSLGTPTTFTFEDFFFHRKDDDYWTESKAEFRLHVRSENPRFFTLITTHHAVARWGIEGLPDDLTDRILVLDEAHHAGSDDEDKESRAIAKFANEWHNRGGTVLYCTATPYRTDDLDVLPEGTVPHIWSMADHAASGFAPSDFRVETENLETEVQSAQEFTGEELPLKEGRDGQAYRQMVDRWVRDGMPKAVFIVPSRNSRNWATRLEAELKDQGARTLNVVGTEAGIKSKLIHALNQERKVRRFEDSQWDVILCCKRFDEGTDWPLASHVYNYGIPSSFGLTIQRWGRAFRNKCRLADEPGIEGHTHPDAAHMVFFVPRIAEDARKHFEKFHHEYTSLLACYLARWTTAQPFGREMRNRGEGPWIRRPRHKEDGRELDEIRDEQTFQLTDYEQAQADRLLVRFETKFKAQHGREPTLGETASHIEEVRAPTRVLLAARLGLLEHLPLEAQDRYRDLILATLKRRRGTGHATHTHPEVFTSDAELRAIFTEVIDPYRDQTVSIDGVVFAIQSRFTGQTAQEVEKELASRLLAKLLLSEAQIVQAARNRVIRGFGLPTNASGDASADFGHPAPTWSGICGALRQGRYGLPERSLHDLLVKHGLRQSTDTSKRNWGPPLTEDAIVAAVHRRVAANKGLPTSKSGDATEDFGYSETWSCVAAALRRGTRGLGGRRDTLKDLLIRHGFRAGSNTNRLTKEAVEQAVQTRVRREGRPPTKTMGDASIDFGFPISWAEVDRFCRRNGITLAAHAAKHKSKGITEEIILVAVNRRVARGLDLPHKASGNASDDFGFCQTWGAVDRLLRDGLKGLPGGSSLSDLLHRHGLRETKPALSEEQIASAIARRVARGGEPPTQKSGDATEDFGHPESWLAVDEALRDGRRGLPGGSSLSDFLVQINLKDAKLDLTEQSILDAMHRSIQRGAGVPNSSFGDATADFGVKEHWRRIDAALRRGFRGLPGGDSLSRFAQRKGLK